MNIPSGPSGADDLPYNSQESLPAGANVGARPSEDPAVEDIEPIVLDAEPKPTSKRAMNSTAYRIFKLLQWLIQAPLSVEAMNQKFRAEPLIGKPVSTDSIWLYINTLKSLGCNIGRPSPKNNFQYEMINHPFGMELTEAQLDALSQAKAFAQQRFTRQEMMALDGLLKKIVAYTVCDDPQARVNQLFSRSRSFDYEGMRHHLEALEQTIAEQGLVQLTYLSPKYGEEQFQFLPVSLFYEQGVVYVRGERPEFSHPSSLRVDRILAVCPAEDEPLKVTLVARQNVKSRLLLHVLAPSPKVFEGFGLDENQGVYREELRWVNQAELPQGELPYCEVTLEVREYFSLKQRLLLCGFPFRIMEPEGFRQEVSETLQSMLKYYQPETERGYGDEIGKEEQECG